LAPISLQNLKLFLYVVIILLVYFIQMFSLLSLLIHVPVISNYISVSLCPKTPRVCYEWLWEVTNDVLPIHGHSSRCRLSSWHNLSSL